MQQFEPECFLKSFDFTYSFVDSTEDVFSFPYRDFLPSLRSPLLVFIVDFLPADWGVSEDVAGNSKTSDDSDSMLIAWDKPTGSRTADR